jgi:Raf kinase inhibitor-like YbhB/YbcL family protein
MSRARRSAAIALVGLTMLVAGTLAACDTGDGKTLRPPTAPPPPPTTTTIAGEGTGETAPTTLAPAGLRLLAPWADSTAIPETYTCDGADTSPPISWTGVPDGTSELAVLFVDLDATGDDGRSYVHWLVTGVDPSVSSFVEASVPPGAIARTNTFGDEGYGGPCPPGGESHRYELTVHALNQPLDVADDALAAEVIDRLGQLSIGSATVVGTYSR